MLIQLFIVCYLDGLRLLHNLFFLQRDRAEREVMLAVKFQNFPVGCYVLYITAHVQNLICVVQYNFTPYLHTKYSFKTSLQYLHLQHTCTVLLSTNRRTINDYNILRNKPFGQT